MQKKFKKLLEKYSLVIVASTILLISFSVSAALETTIK